MLKTNNYTEYLLDSKSKENDSLKHSKETNKDPNHFAHKSKKSRPEPTPGPGDYYLDDNTIEKNMDLGNFGPKLRPNLASRLFEDENK